MHPALSVIVFTVSSGVGYGMLFWLAMNAAMGEGPGLDFIPWPARSGFGIAAFGLAFATIVVGLLSSTLHLGHPERAWRALSQWRSSWLSREGVMAIVTFVPTGLFAIGCVFFERADGWWLVAGIAGAVCCVVTTFCTAMIYASLKPVPAWNTVGVPVLYLLFSLASGAVWLLALRLLFDMPHGISDLTVPYLLFLAGIARFQYWRWIDGKSHRSPGSSSRTVAAAIGFDPHTPVRPLDEPHTRQNYLMREMGFVIARRHARKLRAIFLGLWVFAAMAWFAWFFAEPFAFMPVAGAFAMTLGLLIERWLFFAEAKHTVMLYYRAPPTR
jgi:sulfite dehydrogenase (quinone) subunit SoeC